MNKKGYLYFKIIITLLCLIFLSNLVFAAKIKGEVYTMNLTIAKNVVVDISTSPKQVYVAREGNYNFEVPKGNYVIRARQREDFIATETIKIKDEGDYTIDLILKPYTNESVLSQKHLRTDEESSNQIYYFLGFFLIVVISIMSYYLIKLKNKKQIKERIIEKQVVKEVVNVDKDLKLIIDFMKKEEGRVNQKDLKKIFPLSEAKISLMIGELESKGMIKKIKKGRGNILVLK